jgi:hypothetical protein
VASVRRDRLPLYFLVHLVTLPILRMLPTPAHDGVRLFLPTFFFLAAMTGWGTVWLAGLPARGLHRSERLLQAALMVLVLGPAAGQLVAVHPFELSYYNELVGGPRGAWRRGFELAYWFDAFNERTLADLNARLPRGAVVDFLNERDKPPTFQELQELGELRSDLVLETLDPNAFPYVWLLTHDSKATPFTRLLFAMQTWYSLRPRQLDGLRVATVADPVAVSRAWALWLLAERGEAVEARPRVSLPGVNPAIFDWARSRPADLRAAAHAIVSGVAGEDDRDVYRLRAVLRRFDLPGERGGRFSERLLKARPEALVEAVEILIRRPEAVRTVLTRFGYTDPDTIGGTLDRDLPGPEGSSPGRKG